MADREQVVYLNNCQLFIQSLSMRQKGNFYLVWKKGKKNIQSNIYQVAADHTIYPKEILSLSLKVYYHAGTAQPRYTHLILFNSSGQEVDRTKLMIHEWGIEFAEIPVELGGGVVKLRAKRKGIMKLEKFHKLRNEVEETSEDESTRFMKKISMKKGTSDKDEIIRLTKEVEDLNYLVEKLKEQRNTGLTTIQRLQTQLSQINAKMLKDLQKQYDYFTKKIEMRQSIYKEEIQQLISSFNRNYENNVTIMQNLINEKYDYEEEIKELKISNQEFITKQSQNFQNLISEMERHKEAVDEELKDSNQKLHEREATIIELNQQIDRLNEDLEQLRNQYKRLESEKEDIQLKMSQNINEQTIKIAEQDGLINQNNIEIERLKSQNKFKDEEITSYNNMISEHVKEKNQMHAQNMKLIDEREQLLTKNQILQMNNQQLQAQVKELQAQLNRIHIENEQISKQYHDDLQKMNEGFRRDLQIERDQNLELMQKRDQLEHEKEMQAMDISDKEALLMQKNNDIELYQKQLEQNKEHANSLAKELDDALLRFKEQHHQLSNQLTEYITKANYLESQNTTLHAELRELNVNTQNQLARMKDENQAILQSNKQLLEEEIDMLRTAKDQIQNQASAMKAQYETEISNILEQHRNQMDQMDKIFKEDIDKKQTQIFKILNEKREAEDQFQAFKYKLSMEQAQRQLEQTKNLGRQIKKKTAVQDVSIDQIEEIDEEDEEDYIPLKKKDKKKKKALVFQQHSEEEEQEKEVQEQSHPDVAFEDDEDLPEDGRGSVLDMLERKRSEKDLRSSKEKLGGKLKRMRKSGKETLLQSLEFSKDVEEEEEEQYQSPKRKKLGKGKKEVDINKIIEEKNKIMEEKNQMEERVLELEEEMQIITIDQQNQRNKLERENKRHLSKIKLLENQISGLNSEIQDLVAKLNQQDSGFAENFKKQTEKRKKEQEKEQQKRKKVEQEEEKRVQKQQEEKSHMSKASSQRNIEEIKAIKRMREEEPPSPKSVVSKQSRKKTVLFEREDSPKVIKRSPSVQKGDRTSRQKIQGLEDILIEKQKIIERIQLENRQLNREIRKVKTELSQRPSMSDSRVLDRQKNQAYSKPPFIGDSFMKKSNTHLEQKLSLEKERYADLKLENERNKKQNTSLEQQIRKLKKNIDELEEKNRKQGVPRSNQEMQREIDDCNRKILQLSRNLNQARLERDSFEDEVRIVRKKLAEMTKSNQENQARAAEMERQADDFRRKQLKAKRQIEEYQEDVKRIKEINRKTLEELTEVRKSQSQFILERKKVLDEVVRLEGVIAQKETDLIKANKEIERHKTKMSDNLEGKQGRERQYRTQMERLEIERSKTQRKNREHEQTIRLLKQKLEALERQMKKVSDQRKQTYGQKLKGYIEQITHISQVVEDYQHENSQLKHQNAQFFDQNEMLKISFQKLEIKYEEINDYSVKIKEELKNYNARIQQLQDEAKAKNTEIEKGKIVISSLRKELDNERMVGRKKTDRLQQLEQINERFLYDIKNLKLRLNQQETNSQEKLKLANELFASQETIGSLEEELQKISVEYQVHTDKYIYTLEDVEKAIKELKEHEDKVKEEEMSRIIQELDQNNSQNRQNMEKELLTLYNQNQKLRVNLHKANQNSLQMQMEMAQFNNLREKCKRYQKDKSVLERRVLQLADELKSSKEDVRRLEIKFNQSIRNQENKSTQNLILQQKYDDLNNRYQLLVESHSQLKQDDNKLLEKYKIIGAEKDKNIEKLASENQNLKNKLLANELQINRLKEIESMNSQEYFKSKKKLENKIDELQQNFRQRERQIQTNFKIQIRELKNKNMKFDQELSQRVRRTQELQEGVFLLQNQVEELTSELTNARSQLSEEGELYTLEVNKLRNEMREMEMNYDSNLQNLEEQLSAMSKELTTLKYARENVAANSRMRMSRQSETTDQRGMRRYEDKIKLKDRRIEELKETILAYEEKMAVVSSKQGKNDELQYMKNRYSQAESEWKTSMDKKMAEITELQITYKKLKQDTIQIKTKEEEYLLTIQEKDLEISSLKSELAAISQLYNNLQRQLDKRKDNLSKEMEFQTTIKIQYQKVKQDLEFKNNQNDQLVKQISDLETSLRKKNQEIKINLQKIAQLEKDKSQLQDQERKKLQGQNLVSHKMQELQNELSSFKGENRRLRNEANVLVKQNDNLKTQLNNKNMSITQLISQIQSNDRIIQQNQSLLNKYIALNQETLMKFGINIDQVPVLIQDLELTVKEKEDEFVRLSQEYQELKFQFQNKYIDYEDMKKQNYELTIRNQDQENIMLRLQEMREEVLHIQSEKQKNQFKLETIMLQINNMHDNLGEEREVSREEVKNKLRNIIRHEYV